MLRCNREDSRVLAAWAFVAALGIGCGGSVAPDNAQDSGTEGTTAGDAAADAVNDSVSTCSAVGAACTVASECCSNVCNNGMCTESPACTADGQPCMHAAQCCSGICNGVCGQEPPLDGGSGDAGLGDAGGCSISGSTSCDQCLTTSCCSQVAACEADTTICAKYLDCIVNCEKSGSSAGKCSSSTCQGFADKAVTDLQTCGSNLCISPCSSS